MIDEVTDPGHIGTETGEETAALVYASFPTHWGLSRGRGSYIVYVHNPQTRNWAETLGMSQERQMSLQVCFLRKSIWVSE